MFDVPTELEDAFSPGKFSAESGFLKSSKKATEYHCLKVVKGIFFFCQMKKK